MTLTPAGIDGLAALVGHDLGHSGWTSITQEQVEKFADATGDRQWIHIDPERSAATRFGGTVAHGYLVLSLASPLLNEILRPQGFAMVVNYGCDRVRFLSPVPVGSRLRAGAVLRTVEPFTGGAQLGLTVTFELAERRAPVCVARVLLRAYQ